MHIHCVPRFGVIFVTGRQKSIPSRAKHTKQKNEDETTSMVAVVACFWSFSPLLSRNLRSGGGRKERGKKKEKVYRKHKAAKKGKEERQTEPSLLCCYKHNRYGKSRSQSLEEKKRIIGRGGRLLCSTFQNEVSHEGKRRKGGEKYSCAKPIWKRRKGGGDEAIIVQDYFFPSAVIFPNVGERSEFSDESVPPRGKEVWCT